MYTRTGNQCVYVLRQRYKKQKTKNKVLFDEFLYPIFVFLLLYYDVDMKCVN